MKEVIRKEPETPSNVRKKFWHLNYILPPSDKGNLTSLLSQAPRAERAALRHLDTRAHSLTPPRQAWSHKRLVHDVFSLLLFTALGDTVNVVNSQRTDFPWSQKVHLLPLNTAHWPLCYLLPTAKGFKGKQTERLKGVRKLDIFILKFHCGKEK